MIVQAANAADYVGLRQFRSDRQNQIGCLRAATVNDYLPLIRRTEACLTRLMPVNQNFRADLAGECIGVGSTKITSPDQPERWAAATVICGRKGPVEDRGIEWLAIA